MPGALPAVAFIALILVLIPFALHWRSRNVPLLSIFGWLAISDLIFGINAIIWNGNVNIVVPVWCDITTKIRIGSEIALPVCALTLALQVYRVTLQKSRLGAPLELGLCLGFPFLIMVLHTIVQGHRFDIYENFGCSPAIYVSIPSIIILDVPPLVAATLALIFCTLALINFARQRWAFSRLIQDSHSPGLSKSRYFRLMSLTFLLGVWTAVVICIARARAYRNGLLPWTSWDYVHSDFWLVSQYPTAVIPSDVLQWLYFNWFSVPASSFSTFVFFAFGVEAVREYRGCGRWFASTVLQYHTEPVFTVPSIMSSRNSEGSTEDESFRYINGNAKSTTESAV
ncbi:GPCR fungal pheromone mating factor [Mycena epipterygia]|nr:GPCR fungal pheromone mating factor [Mycena epipterygia]